MTFFGSLQHIAETQFGQTVDVLTFDQVFQVLQNVVGQAPELPISQVKVAAVRIGGIAVESEFDSFELAMHVAAQGLQQFYERSQRPLEICVMKERSWLGRLLWRNRPAVATTYLFMRSDEPPIVS